MHSIGRIGRGPRRARIIGMSAVVVGVLFVFGAASPLVAGATQGSPEHQVTLCHATDSYTNPYVSETVDVASTQFEGHDGHNGPVFYADIPKHEQWGDIIPPFDYGAAGSYPDKNWTADGQAIWNAGCTVAAPTTTTTIAPTTSTTEAPTTTTTEAPTSTTVAPTTSTTVAPTTSTTVAPTTSTTVVPTTSTTEAPTTSTTAAPTTTVPNDPSTSTTIAGDTSTSTTKPSTVTTEGTASTTAPASSTTVGHAAVAHATTTTTDPASASTQRVAKGQLPFTGATSSALAIAGLALVGFGTALAMSRRRGVS